MPPIHGSWTQLQTRTNTSEPYEYISEMRQQWTRPSDIFSVLLLLGGEVVQKALAQLAGGLLTPVTFSFGWASYAVTLLLASVGEAKLMPNLSGSSCLVINVKSGYLRSNNNWVISRMLRDYESWMDPAVHTLLDKMLTDRHRYMQQKTKAGTQIPRPTQTGLCVSIYEPSGTKTAGEPTRDVLYWSGITVMIIQAIVAAIPVAVSRYWSILIITVLGNALALFTGSLPQWRAEKWPCRRSAQNTYVVTKGNGAQHAIVILGNGKGLNLEDLAVGEAAKHENTIQRLCLGGISILWVGLLIAAAGVRTNTWYLMAIGSLGILQNVLVAGWRRNPSTIGVHLDFREVIGEMTAMDTLLLLEAKYVNVGRCLLPVYFPGHLLPEEVSKWEALKNQTEQDKTQTATDQDDSPPKPPESWTSHAISFETR